MKLGLALARMVGRCASALALPSFSDADASQEGPNASAVSRHAPQPSGCSGLGVGSLVTNFDFVMFVLHAEDIC